MIPQAELTLNLRRNARANLNLSAWDHFGVFTFNTTPIAPVGTKVLAHVKPKQRQPWGFHGEDAWYIGPSLDHYRCVQCYVPRTGGVIDVDTVEWFPHHVTFPQASKEDQLLQAAEDIVSILQSPPPSIPALKFGSTQIWKRSKKCSSQHCNNLKKSQSKSIQTQILFQSPQQFLHMNN